MPVMTGAMESVIGNDKDQSIKRFLTQINVRFNVAKGDPGINAVMFGINKKGRTETVKRLNQRNTSTGY